MLTLHGHESRTRSVEFSPDRRRLVTAAWDQTIRIWRVSDGEELTRLHGHLSEIYRVAVSPDGNRIVSGCKDGMYVAETKKVEKYSLITD